MPVNPKPANPKPVNQLHATGILVVMLAASGCGGGLSLADGEPRNAAAVAGYARPVENKVAQIQTGGGDIRVTAKIPIENAASHPPTLVPSRRTQEMPDLAVDALARIGAKAVLPLVEALNDPRPVVRLRAVSALARMGPDAAEAVDPLIELLSDDDVAVRRAAVHALSQIGSPAEKAVDVLMRELKGGEPSFTPPSANADGN